MKKSKVGELPAPSAAFITDVLLEAVAHERGQPPGELHHFMIYIDGDGCYEVVARAWQLLDGGSVG